MNPLVSLTSKGRNSIHLPAFLYWEFVMSILLWLLGGWFALNLAIVATLYFKPLRALRYLRSPEPRPLAFARRRSRPHVR